MKKFIFSAIAIAAMAFTACTEEQVNPVEPEKGTVTVNFVAGDLDTKTYIDAENKVYWNSTGEYLKVFETAGGSTAVADSDEGVVSSDNTTAQFSVTLAENAGQADYTYNAVYPKGNWVDANDNKAVTNLKVITPSVQNPTLTSFDPAADLLIAKPITLSAQPAAEDNLNLNFARVVALGKLVITGLPTSDPVTSVKFTVSESCALTGRSYVNLTEGAVTKYGYAGQASSSVDMQYSVSAGFTNGNTAMFTCFPCEVTGNFTVVVSTKNNKYTRECTIPEGNSIVFEAGKSTKFSVNMATASVEKIMDYSGTYVIAAKISNDTYWALANEESGTRVKAKLIAGLAEVEYTSDGSISWIIEKQLDGKYTIKNGTNYLSWTSGNTADLTNEKSLEGTTYKFDINQQEETYRITFSDRILGRNKDKANEYFAFYTSVQACDLYLISAGPDTRTVIAKPANLTATLGDVKNKVVLDWDDVENANQYVVTYGEETVTAEESALTVNGLDFDKEYTFSVVAKNTDEKKYKASEAATTSITTGTAPQLVWSDPSTFTATVADETKPKEVTLTWTAVENATSYVITWGSEEKTVEAPATTTTVACAAFETKYTFSIVAENPAYKPSVAKTATVMTGAIYATNATVADFKSKEDSDDVWYQLTGVVSGISGTNYNLTDETGTVEVYNHSGFYNLGVKEDDTIVINGTKSTYNNKIQVRNAVLVRHTPLPRAEFAKSSVSFEAASPEAEVLVIEYSSSVEVANVSFEFNGTNADKFSATKTDEGVSVVPVGDNETDAEYTATLNVMYNSAKLCSIEVSQVKAGAAVPVTKTYTFSNYTAGTQYAENEKHVLDDDLTIITTQCHFTTQLRIYSSSSHDGYAIGKSTKNITSLVLNAGNKADTLNVYSSTDGTTWTLVKGISTKSAYADYTVNFDTPTKYFKLDVAGSEQVRVAYITVTTVAN